MSDSPLVHESPFSNDVSRLSPIKPVKASNTAVVQGLPGLNSPPLVFTSPHLTQPCATSFLQRSCFPQVCENEDQREELLDASCNVDKPSTSIRSPLVADIRMDAKTPSRDAPSSSSICIDEYLSEPLEFECANSVNSASVKLEQVNDALQLLIINSSDPKEVVSEDNEVLEIGKDVEKLQLSCKQDEEERQGHPTSEIKQEEVQKEQNDAHLSTDYPSAEGDSLYHSTNREECQMEGAHVNQKHDDSSEVMCVISTGSAQNVMQHDPERMKATLKQKWMATLEHIYLNTPWAVTSVFAASILLVLTLIQTVCVVISL